MSNFRVESFDRTTTRNAPSSSSSGKFDVLAAGTNELTPADIQAIVKQHNDVRARYGVAPLQWDSGLASMAHQWADKCFWGHWKGDSCPSRCPPDKTTRQRLGSDYPEKPRQTGENLSIWTGTNSTSLPGQHGTQLWLNEEPAFNCDTGQCFSGQMCGHLTQILWADSRRFGCALKTCENGLDKRSWPSSVGGSKNVKYLVCEYDPPGNFTGRRPFPSSGCSQPGLGGPISSGPPVVIDAGKVTSNQPERTIGRPPIANSRFKIVRQPVIPPTTPVIGTGIQQPPVVDQPPAGNGGFFAGLRRARAQQPPSSVGRQPPPPVAAVPQRPAPVRVDKPKSVEKVNKVPVEKQKQKAAENNKTNVVPPEMQIDTDKPLPPAPEPHLSGKMPSPSPNIAPVAGIALVSALLLGAGAGALWHFTHVGKSSEKSDQQFV